MSEHHVHADPHHQTRFKAPPRIFYHASMRHFDATDDHARNTAWMHPARAICLLRPGRDICVLPGPKGSEGNSLRAFWKWYHNEYSLEECQAVFTDPEVPLSLLSDGLNDELLARIQESFAKLGYDDLGTGEVVSLVPYHSRSLDDKTLSRFRSIYPEIQVTAESIDFVDRAHKGNLYDIPALLEMGVLPKGASVNSAEEAVAAYQALVAQGITKAIWKPVFGSAGAGIEFINCEEDVLKYAANYNCRDPKSERLRYLPVVVQECLDLVRDEKGTEIAYCVHFDGVNQVGPISDQMVDEEAFRGFLSPSAIDQSLELSITEIGHHICRYIAPTATWGYDVVMTKDGGHYCVDLNAARFNGSHFGKIFTTNVLPGYDGSFGTYNAVSASLKLDIETVTKVLSELGLLVDADAMRQFRQHGCGVRGVIPLAHVFDRMSLFAIYGVDNNDVRALIRALCDGLQCVLDCVPEVESVIDELEAVLEENPLLEATTLPAEADALITTMNVEDDLEHTHTTLAVGAASKMHVERQEADIPTIKMSVPAGRVMLVIHGGAGTINPKSLTAAKDAAYRNTLAAALEEGFRALSMRGSSADGVCAAIRVMEDSPLFNAGKGSVYTHDEKQEMDASIMNHEMQCGAITCVEHVKNPIDAARCVMEKSTHVFLSGQGAEEFFNKEGGELVGKKYFKSQMRLDQLRARVEQEGAFLDHQDDDNCETDAPRTDIDTSESEMEPGMIDEHKFGTVGAVAVDLEGHVCAGTSTGGLTNKRFGRIGDSALIGCGTYCDGRVGVSCTGKGEAFIRATTGRDISAIMEYTGASLEEASRRAMEKLSNLTGGDGGCITLDNKGNCCMPFNTKGMYRGYVTRSGKIYTQIHNEEPVEHVDELSRTVHLEKSQRRVAAALARSRGGLTATGSNSAPAASAAGSVAGTE